MKKNDNLDGIEYRCERLISPIIIALSNGYDSFFIAPDGSKEGWETSIGMDEKRKELLDWCDKQKTYIEYALLRLGGDDGQFSNIERSSWSMDE